MAKTVMAKRPDYPAILIAHDLREGGVVYLNPDGGWSQHFTADAIAEDDDDAERLDSIGARAVDANHLLDLEWIGVQPGSDGRLVARDVRGRIKLSGAPTIFGPGPPGPGIAPAPTAGGPNVSV